MTVKPAVDGMVLVIHTCWASTVCMAEQNRSQAKAQLPAQYNAGPSRTVSELTVQRTLLDTGLRSKRPTRVLLLTKRHRQLRLRLAREHCDWSMD
ncbi:HTH_Tnp_Tc3_2 domain-containing protein [Trichonephila clavipes]|nr:HTH_Tnp_Tc3_2 domain-containing protein [Trichonephila clavipes]